MPKPTPNAKCRLYLRGVECGFRPAYVVHMILAVLDRWIGSNLFVPPIIKLCHITRQSQFAVSKLFWFLAALDALYRAESVLSSVLWGGVSVVMLITATRRADSPTANFMYVRMFALLLFVIGLASGAATGAWAGVEFWLFVLAAEYAASIRILPPDELPQKRNAADSGGR